MKKENKLVLVALSGWIALIAVIVWQILKDEITALISSVFSEYSAVVSLVLQLCLVVIAIIQLTLYVRIAKKK